MSTMFLNKFDLLLNKWDDDCTLKNQDNIIKNIKSYIIKNNKSKLPWTFKEMKIALFRMKSIIN